MPYASFPLYYTPQRVEAYDASCLRIMLSDAESFQWYLGERLLRQVTGAARVPCSAPPPASRIPADERAAALVGQPGFRFTIPDRDYDEWYLLYGQGPLLPSLYVPGGCRRYAGGSVTAPLMDLYRRERDERRDDDDYVGDL